MMRVMVLSAALAMVTASADGLNIASGGRDCQNRVDGELVLEGGTIDQATKDLLEGYILPSRERAGW